MGIVRTRECSGVIVLRMALIIQQVQAVIFSGLPGFKTVPLLGTLISTYPERYSDPIQVLPEPSETDDQLAIQNIILGSDKGGWTFRAGRGILSSIWNPSRNHDGTKDPIIDGIDGIVEPLLIAVGSDVPPINRLGIVCEFFEVIEHSIDETRSKMISSDGISIIGDSTAFELHGLSHPSIEDRLCNSWIRLHAKKMPNDNQTNIRIAQDINTHKDDSTLWKFDQEYITKFFNRAFEIMLERNARTIELL